MILSYMKMLRQSSVCVLIVIIKCFPSGAIFLVIPEDVPAGFAAIYGFAPQIHKGNDHRFGFGFRFGNHADLQILYEFGPQTVTKPLQATTRKPPVLGRKPNRQKVGGPTIFTIGTSSVGVEFLGLQDITNLKFYDRLTPSDIRYMNAVGYFMLSPLSIISKIRAPSSSIRAAVPSGHPQELIIRP